MERKNTDELKARSRAAFDAQAKTYDAGMQGDHARGLYRIVAGEVVRACGGVDSPRVLDLGCGTGALAEIVLDEIPGCALVGGRPFGEHGRACGRAPRREGGGGRGRRGAPPLP